MSSNITINCCDCGAEKEGTTVKEIIKKNGWVHVAKDRWRCKECQDFLDKADK